MKRKLADNPFITEMKDKNGDSWYHQIVIDTIKENKDKEIERLNAELELYKDNQIHLINQLEQKDNIIKEVREYINKNGIIDLNGYDILEILDKV